MGGARRTPLQLNSDEMPAHRDSKIYNIFFKVVLPQHTNTSHKPVLGLAGNVRLPAEAGEGRDRVQRAIGMRGPRAPGAPW
jgi:hypothetical protein